MRTACSKLFGGMALVAGLALPLTAAAQEAGKRGNEGKQAPVAGAKVDQATLDRAIAGWPDKPKEVAKTIIDKYGLPNEATQSLLIWHNNGPWKRTVVYREEVEHKFPKAHTDIVEQFIDFKVPPDKVDELAHYDGSVYIDRTKGELSAKCDKEAMNFLALNLAVDIINGTKSVEDAREQYAKTAMAAMMGKEDRTVKEFVFQVPKGGTADADEGILKEKLLPAGFKSDEEQKKDKIQK